MNKAQLVKALTNIKPEALRQGFNYPTKKMLQSSNTKQLQAFYNAISCILMNGIIREMEDKLEERELKKSLGL